MIIFRVLWPEHLRSSANISTIEKCTHIGKSLMSTRNFRGPNILSWGTPDFKGSKLEFYYWFLQE